MAETAYAFVPTAAAARYAKQLASHLGHRCEVVAEERGNRVVLDGASCLLEVRDDGLALHADGVERDCLARVTDVVGRHLERFGVRHGLHVQWQENPER